MERVAVGLALRAEYVSDLLAVADRSAVDVLEVMIDDALDEGPARADFRRLGARFPLVAHGTELGIGGAAGPSPPYLRQIGAALGAVAARWYSEHLAFLGGSGVALGHFAPLGADDATLSLLRDNAALVRARCPCPLLLENPADVLGWEAERGAAWLGASFSKLLAAADAGALLDLTNLVLGARNDGYEPKHFLEAMDLDRVVEVHLAGGRYDGALWIDSHDHPVDEEALALLGWVAARAPNLRAVVIERDDRLPPLSALLGEVSRARDLLGGVGRT